MSNSEETTSSEGSTQTTTEQVTEPPATPEQGQRPVEVSDATQGNPKKEETKPDETKSEETKTDETKKAEEETKKGDEDYVEFTAEALQAEGFLPEGFTIPEDRQEAVIGFVNKYQLPPEAVQEFAALNGTWTQADAEAAQTAQLKAWEDTQTAWSDEIRNDPVYGGDALDGHLSGISELIDEFTRDDKGELDTEAAKALRQDFNLTGFGNRLSAVKFLSTIAKHALVEEGRPQPGGDLAPGEAPQGLYPHLDQK